MKAFAYFVALAVLAIVAARICRGAEAERRRATRGKASYYGEGYRGKRMANGQRFNPDEKTCASFAYPLGTMLRVTAVRTGRYVIVEVTDRGPALWTARTIDLSQAAFARIAPLKWGVVEVDIAVLGEPASETK